VPEITEPSKVIDVIVAKLDASVERKNCSLEFLVVERVLTVCVARASDPPL
jgi:hypothetical protein